MDTKEDFCRCDECSKVLEEEGSPAGIVVRFVNAIANEFAEEYPDVIFDTFSYRYTQKAPKITKPADNVCIRICTINNCFSHTLEECGSYPVDRWVEKVSDDIKEWNEICDNIYIWDYVTNFHEPNGFHPNFNTMLPNVRFYAENDVQGVFLQGFGGNISDFAELRTYIKGKILWNPYMSEEEYWTHIDEFLEYVYGPGWIYVRQFIDAVQESLKDSHSGCYTDPELIYNINPTTKNPQSSYPDTLTADHIRNYETTDWSQFWNWYRDAGEEPAIIAESERLLKLAY